MIPVARNGWIDLFRALGAISVVLFHLNSLPPSVPAVAVPWRAFWLHGHWGVGIFFALSGYCIFPGWHRATDCAEFLRRRLVRLMPPYWGSLLLVGTLVAGVKLLTGVNDVTKLPADAAAWFAILLLVTNPVTSIPTMNWVYWTLSCVLGFYVLAASALLGPSSRRLVLLAALHGVLCALDALLNLPASGATFMVCYWPVFGSGLALAVMSSNRRLGNFMLTISVLHAFWCIGRGTGQVQYVAVGTLTTAALFLLRTQPFPGWLRPLAVVGEFSYSLYLVHVPIGIHLVGRFLPDHFSSSADLIGTQLIQLGLCLLAAWLFYLLAERPFLNARSLTMNGTRQKLA